MAVHQQHVRAHRIAADLDMIGQRRKHPHATAAMQAASRLEVDRAVEQLVDERERLAVLHDAIALADDPQHPARILTHRREEARDRLAARRRPHRVRRSVAVDRDRLLGDAPAKPRRLDRLRDRRRRLRKDGTQAVPRRLAHREHAVRARKSSRHEALL
jgi:hypothetical protein